MATRALGERAPPVAGIGVFEKWLSVWVALCIAAGVVLGNLFPACSGCWRGWSTPRSTSSWRC